VRGEDRLPLRVAEAAIVEDQNPEPGGGERLVVPKVEPGVLQAEPAGSLDDGPAAAREVVRGPPERGDPGALAVEVDGLRAHGAGYPGVRIRPEPAAAVTLPSRMMTSPRRIVRTGAPRDTIPSAGIQPQR